MNEYTGMTISAAVFLWVIGCLVSALVVVLVRKNKDAPWWKLFLAYVSLPITITVALAVKILRTFF